MSFFEFRRHRDPPPEPGNYPAVFVDQLGDALSIWIGGTFHIQIYRAWLLPYVGFESFDEP